MADFNVRMSRNLNEQEVEKLSSSGVGFQFGGYPNSGEPLIALRTILVRGVVDEQEAMRRVIELLGLDAQEAASVTVRVAAENPA
jgi:hypothetical protein